MDAEAVTRPTAVSLFSGAGGMDWGVKRAGFRLLLSSDMDVDCCQTLRAAPMLDGEPVRTWEGDAAGLDGAPWRGKVDLLFGGPPCQPYSRAGRWHSGDVARLSDPRADTLRHFLRLVQQVAPKAIMVEEVDAFAAKGKDEGLQALLAGLRETDRKTGTAWAQSASWTVLDAASFGVPQRRKRFFLVAFSDGRKFRFPGPTHAEDGAGGLLPWTTAWDALGDLPEDGGHEKAQLVPAGKWAELLPCIPEGWNYQWFSRVGEGPRLFGVATRYWNFLAKLHRSKPSLTVVASPGPGIGPFHWTGRRLSVREILRLQTFPDGVVLAGDDRSRRRQVGNAVPSLLAEVLAREVAAQGFGVRTEGRPTLLPPSRGRPPRARRLPPVPERFLSLVGEHADHPGTGKGPGARRRQEEAT